MQTNKTLLGSGPWTTLRQQAALARFQLAHHGRFTAPDGRIYPARVIAQFDTELTLEDLENSPRKLDMQIETLDSEFSSDQKPQIGWVFEFASGLRVELTDPVRRHDVSTDWAVRPVNLGQYW